MAGRSKSEEIELLEDPGPAVTERSQELALRVRKAYKLFVGGAFVRSESGRYFQVTDRGGVAPLEVENIPRGSRKDLRDAVKKAHGALDGWSARTAFNRSQILYRMAEMMDGRRAELEHQLVRGGQSPLDAAKELSVSIERVLSFAGWADKYQSIFSSLNPVGGPHFDFTVPEPVGVVGVVAPRRPALLGLCGAFAPIIAAGNTAIVVASEEDPRTALLFGEILATSDLPGGVVNLLTGHVSELLPHMASHMEIDALDLHGIDPKLRKPTEEAAAETVKRVRHRALTPAEWYDHAACTTPRWIERFVEMKTIWHPSGG